MRYAPLILVLSLLACSSFALNDPHWIMDPPNKNLRGAAPADDRPESVCDPVKQSDGTLQYQCVAHTFANYQAILVRIAQLEEELKACQQGTP